MSEEGTKFEIDELRQELRELDGRIQQKGRPPWEIQAAERRKAQLIVQIAKLARKCEA